jgi:hypothetical protein
LNLAASNRILSSWVTGNLCWQPSDEVGIR